MTKTLQKRLIKVKGSFCGEIGSKFVKKISKDIDVSRALVNSQILNYYQDSLNSLSYGQVSLPVHPVALLI